jgi:hypothetical protein
VGSDAIVGGGMIVAVDYGVAQDQATLDLTPGNPIPSAQELANLIGAD